MYIYIMINETHTRPEIICTNMKYCKINSEAKPNIALCHALQETLLCNQ